MRNWADFAGACLHRFRSKYGGLHGAPLVASVTAAFVALIAFSVWLGWSLDIRVLKCVLPAFPTMKPNTALCLGLLATALWFSRTPADRVRHSYSVIGLTLLVGSIAVVIACEYIFDWNAGIDNLLFADLEHVGTASPPGRSAPGTALCALLLSGALLALDRLPRLSHALTLAAIFAGLVGGIGYLDNLSSLTGAARYSSLALHTVVGILALSIGILAARPERGFVNFLVRSRAQRFPVHLLVTGAVLLPVALGWLTLAGQRAGWYQAEFTLALFSVLLIVLTLALVWITGAARLRVEEKRIVAENALQESEERFRAMADNIPNLAWMAEANGHIFWYNHRWYEYTGMNFAEMEGWGWQTVHHPDFLEKVLAQWRDSLAHGRSFEMDFPLKSHGGEYRWFLTQVRAVRNEAGEVVRWFGTNTNIDDKRRSEQALRASEELARCVIDASPEGVELLDSNGGILLINEQGRRFRSLRRVQAGPDACVAEFCAESWVESWDANTRDLASASFAQALSGRASQFETVCRQGVEEQVWFRVSLKPLHDLNSVVSRVLCQMIDITASRRAEEELRQTAKLESLGIMAGGIAHDFNNLLTGIVGNASLLAESVGQEERFLANDICLAGERAAQLTRQLLAYSGNGKLNVSHTDLSALVREMLRLVRPSVHRNVEVQLDLGEQCFLEGDPSQLQQIVMNLIINAGEAMEGKPGVIVVRTGQCALAEGDVSSAVVASGFEPGLYSFLEVLDNGKGMDEKLQAKIFDPFFTTKFTGRGLGLAAVSGIVRGHKGVLQLSSAPGQGTRFKVLFPSSQAPSQVATLAEAVSGKGLGTILLADDEDVVRRVAVQILQKNGYRVRVAVNGKEAVELFRTHRHEIDAVVLDVMMPLMGGEEALKLIREMASHVPAVVCSGYSGADIAERLISYRGLAVLQKPFNARQLLRAVEEVLPKRVLRSSPPAAAAKSDMPIQRARIFS